MTAVALTPAGAGASQMGGACPVSTPSGKTINLMNQDEVDFYEAQAKQYLIENTFTHASDLQDLDRLIFLELLVFRASVWLAGGIDYDGLTLSDRQRLDATKSLKEHSDLLSKVKNDLGMTKTQREKAQYESVAAYLIELRQRAKHFGIHREEQLGKGIALIKELFAIVGAYDRADEDERRKIGFKNADEVLDWVRDSMRPEFDVIDDHFIKNHQAFWKKV